jgi:cyclase
LGSYLNVDGMQEAEDTLQAARKHKLESTELIVLRYKNRLLEGDRSRMEEAVDNPERYADMSVGFHRSLCRFAVSPVLAVALVGGIAAHAEPGEVKNLAPGVYVWQGDRDKREPANCMWVIFNDYVLVVDANFPWGAREILPKIRATTNKPIRFVLNTHYHGDHAYGNAIFVDAGAMIVSSEATDKEARTRGADSWAKWNEQAHKLKETREEFASLTFSDHLVFDDGTQRVEFVRLGPAHSQGDTVAYLPKQHIVATGDLCVTWAHGNNTGDGGGSYKGWLAALDKMMSWRVTTVVPGHGEVAGREALQAQRAYLDGMWTKVQAAKQAGETSDQVIKDIDFHQYGLIASDAAANATSINTMFRRIEAGGN